MAHNYKHTQTLYSIQFLRGVAAYLVVAMHATEALAIKMTTEPNDFWHFGSFGVDIFFVISGFIMEYLAKDSSLLNLEKIKNALIFLRKRFIRVVPLYWFYTTLKAIVILAFPFLALRTTFDSQHIVLSYFFIPTIAPWGLVQPFLPVGWTLNFEMFFYFVFALAICLGRNRLLFCLSTFLIIKLIGLFYFATFIDFFSQTIIFEFILGMLIAIYFKKNSFQLSQGAFVLIFLFSIIYLLYSQYYLNITDRLWNYGLPAALIVFSMLGLESKLSRVSFFPSLAKVGDYSYTTYLAHTFIVPALPFIFKKLEMKSLTFDFIIIIVVTYVASYFLYRFIEINLISLFESKEKVRLSRR